MAKVYLEQLRHLIDRHPFSRAEREKIVCKHFFSGAAAYVGGHIFITLTPKGLALKLPERTRERLLTEGATPLRYFPKAPIKRDYAILPDHIAADPDSLAPLIRSSMIFATG